MEPVLRNSTTALTLRELSNDPSFKILSSFVPKEALLKANPGIAVFVLDKRKFTIVNHTDQRISIDKFQYLNINKIGISRCTEKDCHLIAYHPEDHPEIICFEQKDIVNSLANPRFCTELHWEDTMGDHKYSEAFRHVQGGLKLDVNLLASKKAALPNVKWPDHIEENIKKNLMLIMQEISPFAILSSEPAWIEKTSNRTTSRILNFTSHKLTFNDNKILIIDNQKMFIQKVLSSNNCCMIAYHVKTHPHTLCLDVKDDHKTNLMDRIFLTKETFGSSTDAVWLSICAHRCENPIEYKNLLKLQTTCPQDPKQYMKLNNDIKELVRRIHSKAARIETPQVTFYKGRLSSPNNAGCTSITIVNHTNHNICSDVNNRVYIDNSIVNTFNSEFRFDAQIIAYHLKAQPQKILFEQRAGLGGEAIIQRITYTLSWIDCFKSKCHEIFEEICKKRTFKQLWLAKQDGKSLFNRDKFPEEILTQIIHLYFTVVTPATQDSAL